MDVEINKSFNLCFKVLKFYGFWLDGNETKRYRIFGLTMIILCPVLVEIMLIAGIFKNGITIDDAESTTFAVAILVELIRVIDFILKIKQIVLLYNLAQTMMKHVKNKQFIKKRMQLWLKVFIASQIGTFISVGSGHFAFSLSERKLQYPIAVPFNLIEYEIGFWISYCYLLISSSYIGPLYVALDFTPTLFMFFIIGFMEDFNKRIQSFGEFEGDLHHQKNDDELKEIIEVYSLIIKFVKEIERIFRLSFFVIGIVGSIILCTSVFVIPLVGILSIYCYIILFKSFQISL